MIDVSGQFPFIAPFLSGGRIYSIKLFRFCVCIFGNTEDNRRIYSNKLIIIESTVLNYSVFFVHIW